ncbi:CHASE2 domain-containing protein [Oceaniglobus roseus]|uniref:CHASE2 domain-containing protein n=1 Tax=Oceaniglobus roseus TaxID=1737570 RepID=UPI000C7EFAFA|nr:adenylate/guanylate cyclase domain-containing protein [Kandeliimicrobium roseum]
MRRTAQALPLATALVVGLLAAGADLGGLLTAANDAVYDRLVVRMPRPEPPPDAILVAIDDPSFAELGLPWPWPRDLHARLIERLRAAGARAIGYDVVFVDPGPPEDDLALAAALGPDVVLAGYTAVADSPQGAMRMFVGPPAAMTAGGAQVGRIDIPVDPDGAIRRLPEEPDGFAALVARVPPPPPGARISFSGAGVPVVSFYQALDPDRFLPDDTFRDRVVFVGIVLKSSPLTATDSFRTPWTVAGEGFMPGVLIHAEAYRTLAARTWILPVPGWVSALLALLTAAATLLTGRTRSDPAAAAATVGLAVAPLAIAAGGLMAGAWIPPVAASVAALAGGTGQVVVKFLRERQARRHITRIFGHYLAPELVRRLADNPEALKLGGERREVTVLFCDLRGFTSLSERMRDDPAGLTRIVNLALGALAEAVVANQGMVDKFIGDCVMALWNAPADDPDHAAHAMAAAKDMVAAIAALSDRLAAEGLDTVLACGVGINSGTCTVGNMGSALRFDYTAIGDPVNLASRLESLTKEFGTPILVGESTARLLPGASLVELGTVPIRGRRVPERVFGLRSEVTAA